MKYVIVKTRVGDREAKRHSFEAHLEFLDGLRRRGMLFLAGSYEDRTGGLYFIEAEGMEEALSIAHRDPLVQEGIDQCQVKAWRNQSTDMAPERSGSTPNEAVESGPVSPPPAEEDGFQVVEAGDGEGDAEVMVRCFAPEYVPADDPTRLGYLRQARERGMRKLLLRYEDKVAGQLEFAPPRGSGLPVSGDEVAVINCIWVLDAYSGLAGGRRLLAACSAQTKAQSLVTIAYNDNLPWMPAGFFRSQGFSTLEQVETGRFFDNTPIVAHLMWRPLVSDAPQPSWDPARLAAGLDFCPAYPWLHGRRLYWGRRYSYTGVLVKEGLRRPGLLKQLPVLASRAGDNWTMVEVGIPEADLSRAVKLIQAALIDEPTYFAHLYREEEVIIIYPERIFTGRKGSRELREALQYGLEKGIPRQELSFDPLEQGEE